MRRTRLPNAVLALIACAVPASAAVVVPRDLGVDVSHFQGESGIPQTTWTQMFTEGKRFAFIKATEGLTGPDDAAMANNVTRATAAGILNGVYHFAHPENRPTTAGAVQEADHFLSFAGTAIGPGHLRPVLDIEASAATLSTAALTDWVLAFNDRVAAVRGAAATPIVYTTMSFANNELDNRVANLDLWIRDISATANPLTDEPPGNATFPNPLGQFSNWVFWQYSGAGTAGGISPIDLDVVHAEYKPLATLLIPEPAGLSVLLAGVVLVRRRRASH